MSDLFNKSNEEFDKGRPLADLLRPQSLKEVVGQDHLLEEGGPLQTMLEADWLASMILWGPPALERRQ